MTDYVAPPKKKKDSDNKDYVVVPKTDDYVAPPKRDDYVAPPKKDNQILQIMLIRLQMNGKRIQFFKLNLLQNIQKRNQN